MSRIITEGKRTKRYADYVQRCREQSLTPVSFRVFAEADDEYEREWEIANYEYESRQRPRSERGG